MQDKICIRCVMDTSDDSISFDENGNCNYCNDVIQRRDQEYFPNTIGKEKLEKIFSQIKNEGKNREFDCMVGVSGGLDSTYVMYMGYMYDLRMLCVHIDDGLDTEQASTNIEKIVEATKSKLIIIKPHPEEYKDILRSFIKSGVPGLAVPQDNILNSALIKTAKKYNIKYSLSGANFAMESILQRGSNPINANDKKHIISIHKRFGSLPIKNLEFSTLFGKYIAQRYFSSTTTFYPLNYIDYNLDSALETLRKFCGYQYYGGKHYESVLTRFTQCYWMPTKFNYDKRKSHFSSLIMSDQLTRENALQKLQSPPYVNEILFNEDLTTLALYLDLSTEELITQVPHQHSEYPTSYLNRLAPIARKFRKWLG